MQDFPISCSAGPECHSVKIKDCIVFPTSRNVLINFQAHYFCQFTELELLG